MCLILSTLPVRACLGHSLDMGVNQLSLMLFRCPMLKDGSPEDIYFVLVAITVSYVVGKKKW